MAPAPDSYGKLPVLYLNGARVPASISAAIRQVVVQSDLAAPDACRIVLTDPGRDALATAGLEFRAALRVVAPTGAAPQGGAGEKVLFEGMIYSLGFGFDERGATTVAVAYDSSYALFNGVHTATYHNVTDSDLVTTIAGGLRIATGEIASTTVVHDHVGQINETHWDFLTRRAREVDHVLRVRANKLEFVRPTESAGAPAAGDFDSADPLRLTPGGDLEVFSARVTAAQQVSEVEVRGWDDRAKRELVATAPARTRAAKLPDAPADLGAGNAAGGAASRYVAPARPLATQAECDAMVAAVAERIASTSAAADGVAHGDPRILAGVAVSISRTGGRFDGKLTVSHAEHVFDHTGYRTRFVVSGPHDRSLLGLASASGARAGGPVIAGVVPAIVSNINDPESRCRVRVKLPWLAADYETDWARVAVAGGGPDRGMLVLPEVNDEVLVAFEQGDPRRPFVLAGLYNGVDAPPFAGGVDTAAGTVVRRGLRTRKGHEIVVSDADGDEHVEIRTRDGKVRIRLDHDSGGLTVETDADVEIKARGKLSLTAEQDLTISARGTGTISADAGLTLSSRADVTVQGNPIKLN